jgi:hypothetical protein
MWNAWHAPQSPHLAAILPGIWFREKWPESSRQSIEALGDGLAILPRSWAVCDNGNRHLWQFAFRPGSRPALYHKSLKASSASMNDGRSTVALKTYERWGGDEHRRRVSTCRHCRWREMPSFSMPGPLPMRAEITGPWSRAGSRKCYADSICRPSTRSKCCRLFVRTVNP